MSENKVLGLEDNLSYRGAPYQQLVTDKDGKGHWEDQLVYDGRIEISWDGDTTGRVSFIEPQMHDIYYKISDLTPSKEEIIGGTIKFSSNHAPLVITQDSIYDIGEGAYTSGIRGEIVVSFVDNLEVQDAIIIPERGTYVCYNDKVTEYINSLTYGKIKQLDRKYLPSALNQPLNIVFIQQNVEVKSSITCNLTYKQIREQIDNDLPIIATFRYSGDHQRYFIIKLILDENYIEFGYLASTGNTKFFAYFSDGTFGEVEPA